MLNRYRQECSRAARRCWDHHPLAHDLVRAYVYESGFWSQIAFKSRFDHVCQKSPFCQTRGGMHSSRQKIYSVNYYSRIFTCHTAVGCRSKFIKATYATAVDLDVRRLGCFTLRFSPCTVAFRKLKFEKINVLFTVYIIIPNSENWRIDGDIRVQVRLLPRLPELSKNYHHTDA